MQRRVAHDTALAHQFTPDLELRLDEGDHVGPGRKDPEDGRQDLLQGDEGHVDHGERRVLGENTGVERAGVGLLHDDHARIPPEAGIELPGANVHGVDAGGPALQQTVGESAGGGPDVDADPAHHGNVEVVERVDQLLAAAADVGGAPTQLDPP